MSSPRCTPTTPGWAWAPRLVLVASFGGCSAPSTLSMSPERFAIEVEGPIVTPSDLAVPDTREAPNHWRRHCMTLQTASYRMLENGSVLETRLDVPAGDWVVVALESDVAEPHILFDGRLQTFVIDASAGRFGSLLLQAPLPRLPITEPTCVGVVVTVYGAELDPPEPGRPSYGYAGATVADVERGLFRSETSWLLLPGVVEPGAADAAVERAADPADAASGAPDDAGPAGATPGEAEASEASESEAPSAPDAAAGSSEARGSDPAEDAVP